MKIAYVQTKPRMLALEHNLARAEKLIRPLDADLIVLPELFNAGYNFASKKEVARAAEGLNGPTVGLLRGLALYKKAAIVAGFAEKDGGRFYNSAAVVTPKSVATYRKVHLFGREKLFFTPGDRGFKVFDWKGARVGVMVCFDWFFPESARTLALKGAEIIAHPANLVLPWCPDAMRTRALENRVFTVTADRVGTERGVRFIGQSQATDTRGRVLSRASGDREEAHAVSIDPKEARSKKLNRMNDLFKDRRPQTYHR